MHNYKEVIMSNRSTAERLIDHTAHVKRDFDQYYSVEIPIPELCVVYQFGIRKTDSDSMSILIKEGSDLLNWIKAGDTIKMKYYSCDKFNRCRDLETELVKIERQVHGRLRGHYLAGLAILEHHDETALFLPYRPSDSRVIPFQMLTGNR
jgi:hypothetical protein